jgi:hypothetical protein
MIRAAALLLALLCAAPATAQAPAGALDWLVGSWRGAGTRIGAATEARLDVRPALGGRFIELSYVSSGFEGRAFYRRVEGARWRGEWFDNRGVHFGIDATEGERTLTADWGSDAAERGRTVYRLLQDGRLELVDQVTGRDGIQREFARHTLARDP